MYASQVCIYTYVRVVCGCLDMSAALKRSGTAGMYIWHYISILKFDFWRAIAVMGELIFDKWIFRLANCVE